MGTNHSDKSQCMVYYNLRCKISTILEPFIVPFFTLNHEDLFQKRQIKTYSFGGQIPNIMTIRKNTLAM